MPELSKPAEVTFFVARSSEYEHQGYVDSSLVVTTGLDVLESFASESQQLAALTSTKYPPLPGIGAELQEGELYNFDAGVVKVRQSHIRTEHMPSEVPALFITVNSGLEWIAGERVARDTVRSYNDTWYVCIQAHVTQSDWTPPQVPALWRPRVEPTSEWQARESVSVGDERLYNNVLYRCLQSHTTQIGWEPPNVPALWKAL